MSDCLLPMKPRKGDDPKMSVTGRTGLGRSTIYRLLKAGQFPRPVPSGCTTVLFSEEEVDAWIEARKRERDEAVGNA